MYTHTNETMQEDFLTSPVNRQTGCKQFTSSVVGGPATTVLSPCSLFVCNDICSTGDLTYSIAPIQDYYGKRLVILKTQNTTGSGHTIRIQLPGLNTFNTTGTNTLTLPDLPSTTELVFPINGNIVSDTTQDSSPPVVDTNIYNTDGSLTGYRTIDLNNYPMLFQGHTQELVSFDQVQEFDVVADQNVTINSPQILLTQSLPANNALTELVVQDQGTGQLKRRSVASLPTPNDAIFSVGMSVTNFSAPYSTLVVPTNFGQSLATTKPSAHIGYDNSAGALNLATGVYSTTAQIDADILARVNYRCNTEVPNFSIEFVWVFTGIAICTANFNYGTIGFASNTTYSMVEKCRLPANSQFFFRIIPLNGAGTSIQIDNALFSINLA